MSSPSETDSDLSAIPNLSNPLSQSRQYEQEDSRPRRQTVDMTPFQFQEVQSWAHRPAFTHSAGTSSSSPSSSRAVSSIDQSRHLNTPFSMTNMPVEARRQNIMAMDRKRRLTGSIHENGARRRNLSTVFNDRDDLPALRAPDTHSAASRQPTVLHRQRSGPSTSSEVIDLTRSPTQPAVPPFSLTRGSSGSTNGGYVLPRWQPDSDVAECTICKTPFTFLFRRHHCRKCGRVVCNDCSPHRITIPRQYIVNPPGPHITSTGDREILDLTGDEEDEEDITNAPTSHSLRHHRHERIASIGGGEKVRLCNPCVPDPQPELQPNHTPSSLSSFPGLSHTDDLLTLSDALRTSRHDAQRNHNSSEPFPGFVPHHSLQHPGQPLRLRPLPQLPQVRGGPQYDGSQTNQFSLAHTDVSMYHRVLPFMLTQDHRYRHRDRTLFDGHHSVHGHHHSSDSPRSSSQSVNRPRVRSMLDDAYMPAIFGSQLPPVRQRLNEEDICPVCRRALPPKGPGGDETIREAHIMDCISSRDPAQQASTPRGSAGHLSHPRGPMHMLPFIATEKDCVGDDGNVPECSICMVEYDVGDELARLECLCKFHRECISEWFARKQECPVHKIS